MGAAVSIIVLFTVSTTIVRVAGVFLEHTGLPRGIARLQAMSALSGTGFTTSESELIVRTPERRKILTVLIATGSIGLASVVATLVVGAFGVDDTFYGVALQAGAIILSILFVRNVLFSRVFDDLVCGIAHAWLARRGGHAAFEVLCMLDPGHVVAVHKLGKTTPHEQTNWPVHDLVPLIIRTGNGNDIMRAPLNEPFPAGAELILSGPVISHEAFAESFGTVRAARGH